MFSIALFGFMGNINTKVANSLMILIACILQIVIGYIFYTKNKKKQSMIFYCIAVIIFVLLILSIIY